MPLQRDHCSWKFHLLHFLTAVNRAIKPGISRTPGISLVNRARRKRNASLWRPLQNGGKFAKTVTIAENGQRSETRCSKRLPFMYIHATRARSRHYPIFRDAIPVHTGWRMAWAGNSSRSFSRCRISHVQGCWCNIRHSSNANSQTLKALYYAANKPTSYDDDFRLSS